MLERLRSALADRYRLERELGQGGMATVYLAEDLRHHRPVALKVLRPELAAVIGAERFLHEITTTANLQHPHILPLFDSGRVGGSADGHEFVFYVMPYVEGESLRDRLTREKQLPVDAAVRIAAEVASALDYAHGHGVIHRDIKPENILLHGGHAMVSDFGIALAAAKTGGSRMTETGMSLGTPTYMSPEQAMGERNLDARSDIYALGCVLYEMLSGEPPFSGPTAQSIVAKVLTDDPKPLHHLRRSVIPGLEAAVEKALEKLPADRFASAAEFAAALDGSKPVVKAKGRTTQDAGRKLSPAMIVVPILLAAAAFALGRFLRPGTPANGLTFGKATQVTFEPGLEVLPAISPDGKMVAYAAGIASQLKIFVRPVTGGRPIAISSDSTTLETSPSWSSDGSRVLFLALGGAFSAPASGGAVRQELPAGERQISWAAWSPDGKAIAWTAADSLFVRNESGESRSVAPIASPGLCAWSPDGGLVACASGNPFYALPGLLGNISPSRVVVTRVSDGVSRILTDTTELNQNPVWSPDGRSLYFISNRFGPRDVLAQPVSEDGAPNGPVARLTTGLNPHTISLSRDGRVMAWAAYTSTSNIWSVAVPGPGAPPVSVRDAVQVTFGNQVVEDLHPTPDGKWLFYDSNLAGNSDIYRVPLRGGEPERLTTDPSDDFSPDPSPDGREVAFHSWRSGSRDVYVMPLDGRPAQRLTTTTGQEMGPYWSPDGRRILFTDLDTGVFSVMTRAADGSWSPPVARETGGPSFGSGWSPDGRFLLFTGGGMSATLRTEGAVGVIGADSGAPRVLVGGELGRNTEVVEWSADGRFVYFKSRDARGAASFWEVPAAGGTPRQLVRFDDPTRPSNRNSGSVRSGRAWFTIEDQRSDIWVMELDGRTERPKDAR